MYGLGVLTVEDWFEIGVIIDIMAHKTFSKIAGEGFLGKNKEKRVSLNKSACNNNSNNKKSTCEDKHI